MEKFKKIKITISWTLYVTILIGLFFGIPYSLKYLLNTSQPAAVITSGSMWPSFKRGDIVLIKGVKNAGEEIGAGDVVVYQNQKGLTVHRVVEKNEKMIITKGDANNRNDLSVKYEEIVGKILSFSDKPFRIPFLGYIAILIDKIK